MGNCGQAWAAKLLKLHKTPVFVRLRSDCESAAPPLSYLGPSVNPLPLPKCPQTDEPDFPFHLCLNGLSSEPNPPANPRPVAHVELAKATELQRKSIRAQMIEQGGLQAADYGADDVLSLFLRR